MSIIAMSGKMQSGKNTVASIIQYLYDKNNLEDKNKDAEEDFNSYIKNKHYLKSNWKQVAFADKLKDIICLLINCTREQLEDESFKSKELGEEWWYFKGRNGSLIPYSEDSKRNDEDLIKPTPRFLLQFIGTNLFRNQLHPEIWVNSLMSEYKPYPKGVAHDLKNWSEVYRHTSCKNCGKEYNGWKRQYLCKECIEDNSVQFYPNWIITDTRFENELEAVKKRGGITIRVNRPCNICGGSGYHKMSCPVSKSGEHLSETILDKAEFDYVVDNDSDIESLIEKIREILKIEKII